MNLVLRVPKVYVASRWATERFLSPLLTGPDTPTGRAILVSKPVSTGTGPVGMSDGAFFSMPHVASVVCTGDRDVLGFAWRQSQNVALIVTPSWKSNNEENRAEKDPDRAGVEQGEVAAAPPETSPHKEPVEIDVEAMRKTSDLARLQGAWKIVTEERPDKKLEGRDDLGWLLFSGDRFLLQSASERRLQAKFNLLQSSPPRKKINLITESGNGTHEVRGIYSFDDYTLKLCLPNDSDQDRPTEFAAGGESSATLVTLRRVPAGLLFVNPGRVFEPNVGAPIKSVWVPDTSVLEVAPVDEKRIRITTKKVGGTVLRIVDQNDDETQMDIIVINPDDLNFDNPAPVVRERDPSVAPPPNRRSRRIGTAARKGCNTECDWRRRHGTRERCRFSPYRTSRPNRLNC